MDINIEYFLDEIETRFDRKMDEKIAPVYDCLYGLTATVGRIENKIDKVLDLIGDFVFFKNEDRDIEEKVNLMCSKISATEKNIPEEDLETYSSFVQDYYDNWEAFDQATKRCLPFAELLYSMLQRIKSYDYSSVILELCRALENELLQKIFRSYTSNLIFRKKGNSLDRFLLEDKKNPKLETQKFCKAVIRASKSENNVPKYTLGEMNKILSLLNDEDKRSNSPLLSDFFSYLENIINLDMLLDSEYREKINEIINEYRNPSAHTDEMPKERADECKKIMPYCLDYLLESMH